MAQPLQTFQPRRSRGIDAAITTQRPVGGGRERCEGGSRMSESKIKIKIKITRTTTRTIIS